MCKIQTSLYKWNSWNKCLCLPQPVFFGYQSTQTGKACLQFCIYWRSGTFHKNWLYYLSEARVFAKEMLQFMRYVAFGWNVPIYALCRIWLKCCDLRALSHLAETSRFTRFARHKMSAARHLKLFCTPGLFFDWLFLFSIELSTFNTLRNQSPHNVFCSLSRRLSEDESNGC